MQGSLRSVLIFGGAGFIGCNWAHHLLTKTNARVHVFDNLSRSGVEHNLRWLRQEPSAAGRLKVTIGDVRDAEAVRKAVCSATEIYHLAAQVAVTTSMIDPRSDFEVNVGGTLNILEAARSSEAPPFLLFTSTNKVYGHIASRRLSGEPALGQARTSPDCTSEGQPLDF